MILSNLSRAFLASLVVSLLTTIGFFATSEMANAQRSKGPKIGRSNPTWNPEEQSTHRLLLRYQQLWNLYRVRNDVRMSESEAKAADQLIREIHPPLLHAQMSPEEIRSAIRSNSAQLTRLLTAEVKAGVTAQHAESNLKYLRRTLLKGLDNPIQYAMSDLDFRAEFLRNFPVDAVLPDEVVNRLKSEPVVTFEANPATPSAAASGVSQ